MTTTSDQELSLDEIAKEMIEVAKANPWNPLDMVMFSDDCRRDIHRMPNSQKYSTLGDYSDAEQDDVPGTTYRLQLTHTVSPDSRNMLQLSVGDRSAKMMSEATCQMFKRAFFGEAKTMSIPSQWKHVKCWVKLP